MVTFFLTSFLWVFVRLARNAKNWHGFFNGGLHIVIDR
jgi:hypothetical protein